MSPIRFSALISTALCGTVCVSTPAFAQSTAAEIERTDDQMDAYCAQSQEEASAEGKIVLCHPRYQMSYLDTVTVIDRGPSSPGSFAMIQEQDVVEASADHPAEILNSLPGVNV